MAIVRGSGPQAGVELRALLYRRLVFLTALTTVIYASITLVQCAPHLSSATTLVQFGGTALPWFGMTVVCALSFAILRTHRQMSLSSLRVLEGVLFGLALLQMSWVGTMDLRHYGLELIPQETGKAIPPRYALFWSPPYFALIVGYGIVIPNSGRRCMLVVGAIALTPVLLMTWTALAAGAFSAHFFRLGLAPLLIQMTLASALSVYGSHRIEVLRRESFQARKLGQYQLRQRLGAGGMGEVYLAEHVLLRRPCAVKIIVPGRSLNPTDLRRFEREVQSTASLTHPNTIQIFDYGHAEDGTFYYAMEYLPGLNLEEMAARGGALPPERVVHLLRQVCGALREAHAAGLIHRDIKPSNIIACERGGVPDVAKVLDFGLVRRMDQADAAAQLTHEGTIAGTPAYMSPEQATSGTDIDPRSDIYSLGVVAYFLLTGRPPFQGEHALQVIVAHMRDRVPPLTALRPDVPADLQEVVLRCLEKEPARRFQAMEELEQALAGCGCAGQWTTERAAAWWQRAPAAAT